LNVVSLSSAGADAITYWFLPVHSLPVPSCCEPRLYHTPITRPLATLNLTNVVFNNYQLSLIHPRDKIVL